MKKFFKEFKEFLSRGNILDLAVGVIIGGSFNTVVGALNQKVLMPVVNWALSYISGGSELCTVLPNYVLYDELKHAGATPIVVNGISYYTVNYINWSALIEAFINFFFVALTLFIIVKVAKYFGKKRQEFESKFTKKVEIEVEPEPIVAPEPVKDPVVVLLEEIRDSIKSSKTE